MDRSAKKAKRFLTWLLVDVLLLLIQHLRKIERVTIYEEDVGEQPG